MSAVLWGLLSALLYGSTDFAARFASQATGVIRTMFYGQFAVANLLSCYLILRGAPPQYASASTAGVLIVSDLVLLAATACLYRALAVGRLALVSPLAACYGAIGAFLSLLSGERLTHGVVVGLIAVSLGAMLAARTPSGSDASPREHRWPDWRQSFYATGFWLQGRFLVRSIGPLIVAWSYYAMGVVCLALPAIMSETALTVPRGREASKVFGVAALASGGYLALLAGQSGGGTAVVTALSSLASAVTVVLARLLLKEQIGVSAWIGLITVVGGLMLHTAEAQKCHMPRLTCYSNKAALRPRGLRARLLFAR